MKLPDWVDWLPHALMCAIGGALTVAIIGFGYEPAPQSVAVAAYVGLMVSGFVAVKVLRGK